MLPYAVPCSGKTGTFKLLAKQSESTPSLMFVQGKGSGLHLDDKVKLVILVKSSDEFSARMIAEHRQTDPNSGKSDAQITSEMREGFFPEVVDDFKFLCELVKGEQRSAVLILDKNHLGLISF